MDSKGDCQKAYHAWREEEGKNPTQTSWRAFKKGWNARVVDVGLVDWKESTSCKGGETNA